jgi:predicted SnoaL-like aldol condensation-catalyzing enzyme
MANETANMDLVKRYLDDFWVDGKVDHADEYFASNFVAHDSLYPNGQCDYRQFVQYSEQAMNAFADITPAHAEHFIASGDLVVVHFMREGKQIGHLMGIPQPIKKH